MLIEVTVVTPIAFGAKGNKIHLKPGNHEIEEEYLNSFDAKAYITSGDLIVKKAIQPAFPVNENSLIEIEIGANEEPVIIPEEKPEPKFRKIRTKKEK